MKIAYLILAHNTPNHLQRLIPAIASPSAAVFIHLDKKANIDAYSGVNGNNVRFTQQRVRVFWGDFSQAEAILILLETAEAVPRHFDRFVLLSGADYPLRSAAYIEQFFERSSATEYMNLFQMPSHSSPN